MLSGSPQGATAPCCQGPLRGATVRRALSGSPSGSDGARPSGSLRGATAEAQGYCQGPFGERRCPTVRVPSGERRFEGRCQGPPRGATAPDRQGPYGERRLKRKGTVRVPSGSDGALLSGSLRGATFEGRCQGPPRGATAPDCQGPYGERRYAAAAKGLRCSGRHFKWTGGQWVDDERRNNPWHGCLGRERRSDEQRLPLPVLVPPHASCALPPATRRSSASLWPSQVRKGRLSRIPGTATPRCRAARRAERAPPRYLIHRAKRPPSPRTGRGSGVRRSRIRRVGASTKRRGQPGLAASPIQRAPGAEAAPEVPGRGPSVTRSWGARRSLPSPSNYPAMQTRPRPTLPRWGARTASSRQPRNGQGPVAPCSRIRSFAE